MYSNNIYLYKKNSRDRLISVSVDMGFGRDRLISVSIDMISYAYILNFNKKNINTDKLSHSL